MLRELIQEVLDLQTSWSSINSPEMAQRGMLVRRDLPAAIAPHLDELARVGGFPSEGLRVEGSDGKGLKSEVPWMRIFCPERSPNARTSWYIVYLFAADGSSCYLTLDHGSTQWTGGDFKTRPPEELRSLAEWAQHRLSSRNALRADLISTIELAARKKKLGASYEAGAAYAIAYRSGELPLDEQLLVDLHYMVALMGDLFRIEDIDVSVPGRSPEIVEVVTAIEGAAGRAKIGRRGQGRALSRPERDSVEQRAVNAVTGHLTLEGWDVGYVGDSESFDILARRDGEEACIAVKGTTSQGDDVVVTANEAALHRRAFPANALFVVHSIRLDSSQDPPYAHGGVIVRFWPWDIDERRLTALAFRYSVPLADGVLIQVDERSE